MHPVCDSRSAITVITGGHLLLGHQAEVQARVNAFLRETGSARINDLQLVRNRATWVYEHFAWSTSAIHA